MFTIKASSHEGQSNSLQVEKYPDTCPICHTAIHPTFITAVTSGFNPTRLPQVVFGCRKLECHRLFIGIYDQSPGSSLQVLRGVIPLVPKDVEFSEAITELSPMFVQIYKQSVVAETFGLHQLHGIGLRKALEFLVKDFAKSQMPTEKDAIENTQPLQCINNYLDDQRIR